MTTRRRSAAKKARRSDGNLTRRELAAAVGVHLMTITKWEREGLPIVRRGCQGRPSYFNEPAVRAWLKAREETAASNPVNLFADRARRERAQALLIEQTHATRAGELLRKDDVERAWIAEVTAVRTRLLAWPMTLADQLYRAATLEGLHGVEQTLTDAVHQVLRELSAPPRPVRSRQTRTSKRRRRASPALIEPRVNVEASA